MAKPSVIINGVTYTNVPEVNIPKEGSGTVRFFYTGDADITAGDILNTKVGFGASGEITGNMANNGATGGTISTKAGTVTIPTGYTTGGSVSLAAAAVADLTAANLLSGKTVLGVSGELVLPTISQDSTTKVLSIS